jgi:hypothetical protein
LSKNQFTSLSAVGERPTPVHVHADHHVVDGCVGRCRSNPVAIVPRDDCLGGDRPADPTLDPGRHGGRFKMQSCDWIGDSDPIQSKPNRTEPNHLSYQSTSLNIRPICPLSTRMPRPTFHSSEWPSFSEATAQMPSCNTQCLVATPTQPSYMCSCKDPPLPNQNHGRSPHRTRN